ncbi:MAG: class I SAM-dependent methyltransferase [Solirubrobacterales bacterium]
MPSDERHGEVWDLESLAKATGLCDWMFDQFADLVDGSVLEVGAGIGTFSQRLLDGGASDLLLIEPEPACMAVLEDRFSADERVELARDVLPGSPALDRRSGSIEFALCQNVLEHIADHDAAVEAIARSLKPGGRIGVLVPAHPALFGRLDQGYGHKRRYTRDSLRAVLEGAGLGIEEMRSFNLLGVPGWWAKNRFGGAGVDSRSLRVYEQLLRAWRPLEERLRPGSGLSLVAVGRKPG